MDNINKWYKNIDLREKDNHEGKTETEIIKAMKMNHPEQRKKMINKLKSSWRKENDK